MWAAKRGATSGGTETTYAPQDDAHEEAAALLRAARVLGVPAGAALRRALLAAAAERVAGDPAFAACVWAGLGAGVGSGGAEDDAATGALPISEQAAQPILATKRGARPTPRLVPIARVEQAVLDPFGPPDPLYLLRLYGAAQLPIALAQYSYASLKEAAALLPPEPAGERPRGRRSKDELIAGIVARVTALA